MGGEKIEGEGTTWKAEGEGATRGTVAASGSSMATAASKRTGEERSGESPKRMKVSDDPAMAMEQAEESGKSDPVTGFDPVTWMGKGDSSEAEEKGKTLSDPEDNSSMEEEEEEDSGEDDDKVDIDTRHDPHLDEEMKRYYKQVEESEGFDCDIDPRDRDGRDICATIYPIEDPYSDGDVVRCARYAAFEYSKTSPSCVYLRQILKANIKSVKGSLYYITMEVEDAFNLKKILQARVLDGLCEIKVQLVRERPKELLQDVQGREIGKNDPVTLMGKGDSSEADEKGKTVSDPEDGSSMEEEEEDSSEEEEEDSGEEEEEDSDEDDDKVDKDKRHDPHLDEEMKRYYKQVEESEGFDCDFDPRDRDIRDICATIYPIEDPYSDGDVVKCARYAVFEYNKTSPSRVLLRQILKANIKSVAGSLYYITMEVEDVFNQKKILQARVFDGFHERKVQLVRERPNEQCQDVQGIDRVLTQEKIADPVLARDKEANPSCPPPSHPS